MNSFKKNILKYGTFALFFFMPIMYWKHRISPYMTSKTFFFYGLVNFLFFYYIYLIITDKSYRLSKIQLFLFVPLFLYIIWLTISGILAVNPHLAFWSSFARGTGLLTLYYATALALIISSLVRRNGMNYVYSLLKWFMVSSAIVALSVWFGNEGFNIQTSLFMNSAGGGLIGNSSFAAAYLIFSIFLGIFLLFVKTISKKQKIFIGSVVAIIFFSPLFLNLYALIIGKGIIISARGAFLGIFVGIGITTLCYFALSKSKVFRTLGIIGIFVSLIIFSVGWAQLMKPNTTLHNKFYESTTGTRFIFWNISQKAMDKHPYFGYGPENYLIAFQENFDPKILNEGTIRHESWNDRAHNIYYDTGVSGGYPAIIFYLLFILSIFYAILKAFRKDKISQIQASVLFGLLMAYLFQNLFIFDSTLSIIILFSLAGLVYGMLNDDEKKLISSRFDKKNEELKGVMNKLLLKILIGGFLVVFCIVLWIYFSILPARKALAFRNVFAMSVQVRPDHYKDLLRGSSIGNDWDVGGLADYTFKFYAMDPISVKNNKKMLLFYEKDLTAFLEYLEIIAKENPNDFRLYKKIFDLYSTSFFLSDKQSDLVLLKHLLNIINHAKELSPTNPETYWGIAQLYAWSGDLKGVEQAYKQGIAIDPSIDVSHKLLIQFAQTFGNQKLYNEAIIQAEKDIPGFVKKNQKELNIIIN